MWERKEIKFMLMQVLHLEWKLASVEENDFRVLENLYIWYGKNPLQIFYLSGILHALLNSQI